ncbi:MAG: hypothetical protein K2Q03_10820 [Sphingobacteriaceae bacterium]|nr:hypothetical protein [Sphingobacteriaceae bacterium]
MRIIRNNAISIFLGLLAPIVVFHLCIVVKIIPYSITWGGRLTNDTEMYVFETISILVNLFLIWILLMKAELVKIRFSPLILKIILWFFFGLFVLNTAGNVVAKTNLEKFFAFVTAFWAILLLYIQFPPSKKLKP